MTTTRVNPPGQKKPAPKVDLDATRDRLLKLALVHSAEQLEQKVTAAVKDPVSPHQFLDSVLDVELAEREERRIRTSMKLSGLPTGQTLANFDFAFQPSVERSRIETLGTCAWARATRCFYKVRQESGKRIWRSPSAYAPSRTVSG